MSEYFDRIKRILSERKIPGVKTEIVPAGVTQGLDDALVGISRKIGLTKPATATPEQIKAAREWIKSQKNLDPKKVEDYEYALTYHGVVPDDIAKALAPAPAKVPAPAPTKVPAPKAPDVLPKTLPGTEPKTLPATQPKTLPAPVKPETLPATKPATLPAPVKPETLPATKPATLPATQPTTKVIAKPQTLTVTKTETKPATKTATKTATKVPTKTPTSTVTGTPKVPGLLPVFGGAKGRDLRTVITGTGVREEFVAEEETRFKKFKVMYILGGQEKTNVYRYKGKDTFAKARVLRQLRERGAGSIRFMQYESVEEGVSWSPGVGWIGGASDEGVDERGDGYRVNPKTGENERVRAQYNYGYKSNNRRKALPTEKIYHKVSYKDKDEAKAEGMRWDGDAKKWYHTSADRSEKSKFKKLEEAYMPDATRKPVVYRAPPKRGEVVGKMKVRLIRRHQDVMPGERTATSDNTKRLRKLIRKVLKKGKLKR